jgi:hypothetical protein
MKSFDLYGQRCGVDLESAHRSAEKALDFRFIAHESSYHGGDYYRFGDVGTEHFVLKRNYDGFEKEWAESRFKEHSILLYVNESQRAAALERLLTSEGFELLRRENL